VKDYAFGTNDFTISTWYNVPEGESVSDGAGTYLFGNCQPDEKGIGFALCLKKDQIRFRLNGGNQTPKITYTTGTWNNIVLSREGDTLKLYFNGTILGAYDLPEGCDFGTKDLAFGGYYNNDPQLYYLMLGLASVLTVGIGVCGDFLNRLVNFRSGGCWLCELAAMLGAGSLIGVFSAQGQAIMGYAISELCYEFGWYGLSQDIMYYTWSIFAEAVGQALLYLYYRYVLFACTLDANKASGTTAPEAAPVTEAAPEAPQVVVVRE
jgi:hypothetical protein